MRKTPIVVIALLIVMVLASCASSSGGAGKKNSSLVPHEFTDIAVLPNFTVNYNGKEETVTAAEGCVVHDGYAYVAKIKNNKAGRLFRIDINTGEVITMTDADTGLEDNLDFYHANDMAAFELEGRHYLLVGTLSSDDNKQLALVELVGAEEGGGFRQYRFIGFYRPVFKGMYTISAYGVEILSIEGRTLKLLIKSGTEFYNAVLDLDSDRTKIPVTKAFAVAGGDVLVDGQSVNVSLNDYYQQGFTVHEGKLLVPFTRIKEDLPHSIVFVYELSGDDSVRNPLEGETLMFQQDSTTKFEIETLSFYDGRMYFSTNRNSPEIDGFHCFEF